MREQNDTGEPGPYDPFLSERLARLREEHPEWLRPVLRLHLIQALRDETPIEPREVFGTVDDFLKRNGLGPPPFSPKAAVLAVVVGVVVILAPFALLYFLWKSLMGR